MGKYINLTTKIITIIIVVIIIISSCTDENKQIFYNDTIDLKDTLNVADIRDEFRKRLNSTGEGVRTLFFNINNQRVLGLKKGDTFFVQVNYISDKFVDLVKNHNVELYYAKGDFVFLGQNNTKDKYKLAVGINADTIEFDVFLKSKKYIFNDYFLEDGEIKYELTQKMGLCRLTNLPK